MNSIGIKFSNRNHRAFTQQLKQEVGAYFKDNNISQKANGAMKWKTVCLLMMMLVPYALIMSNQLPLLAMWLCTVVMSFGVAGIGFSVTHDALHGAYSSNPRVNAALGWVLDVIGGSSYLWKFRHNTMHHTYTNIEGADVDLSVSKLIRLTPGTPHLGIHRYQSIYAFFAYCFATIQWVLVKDYVSLFRKNMGPYRDIKHAPHQYVGVIGMKLLYYLNTIVLPLLLLDITLAQYLIGFFTFHLTAGFMLTVVFQLAHVVEGPCHYQAEEEHVYPDAWMVHQLQTTANFAPSNRPLSWFIGGLNYQIEHHLFPRICSIHYPKLSPIVRRVAEEHGIPYYQHATLRAAVASHYRMLRLFGDPKTTVDHFATQAAK